MVASKDKDKKVPPNSDSIDAAKSKNASDVTAKEPKMKKKVNFSTKKAKVPPKNPAKIGKADPKRDSLLFLAFVLVLGIFSWKNDGIGRPQEDVKPRPSTISQVKTMLEQAIVDAMAGIEPRFDCDLFLFRSSIPGAGLGIYAGKNYTSGENIMTTGMHMLPLELEETTVYFHSIAALLKHHPDLDNVETEQLWTTDPAEARSQTIRASRDIVAGEEIFVNYAVHPHQLVQGKASIFDNIPVQSDYDLVTSIVHDIRITMKARTYSTPKTNYGVISAAIRVAYYVLARYNPTAASILPKGAKALIEYTYSNATSLLTLSNSTHARVAMYGMCISDAHVPESSESGILVAHKDIQKNKTVLPVPFFLVEKQASTSEDQESCPSEGFENCLHDPETNHVACPLGVGPIRILRGSDADNVKANVYFRLNVANSGIDPMGESTEISSNLPHESLAVEAVAMRNISAGEELVADNDPIVVRNLTASL